MPTVNKHTQGEWKVNLSENFPEEILDENDNLIARLRWEDGQPFGFKTTEESEANANLIVKAVNNHSLLIEALQSFHDMFIHREGELIKNKAKTNMIKYCDEVKDALNKSRQLLQQIEQTK